MHNRYCGGMEQHRSGCPINLSLEVIGDRWSLIVLRDIIFGGRKHFRELLVHSEEGIASNVLSSRLKSLVSAGLLTRKQDPSHKQKAIYSLTEASIQLLPVIAELGAWGANWLDVTEELSVRARLLAQGGRPLWERFMAELREEHLGEPASVDGARPTVREELQAAYLDVLARASTHA